MIAKYKRHIVLFFFLFLVVFGLNAQNERPHVVFIAGEEEYGAHWTLPKIADDLQRRFNIKTTVIHSWRSGAHDYDMPGEVVIPEYEEIENLEIIKDADLVVMHIRFRLCPPEQLQMFREYFDSGKPAIAFRTTSHGMWAADQKGWFVQYFGGHYKGHMPNSEGTTTIVPGDQLDHPILRGVPKMRSWNDIMGIYFTAPLNDTTTPLMMGKTGQFGPAQPVSWINEYQEGQKIFYTSLGGLETFADPGFLNMVYNAVYWALDREVPENGVFGIDNLAVFEEEAPFERNSFGAVIENPFDRPEEELELKNAIILKGSYENQQIPEPPKTQVPDDAVVLFDGTNLSKWRHWDVSADPVAMLPDARAVSPSPDFPEARWSVADGMIKARPGFGSIVTRESFGNYRLHLDFLIPTEPDYVPEKFKGSGGIFLDGRYEIKIHDSYGKDVSVFSNGALFNQLAPELNASRPVNTWQSLDIEYRQYEGQRPVITVDLNGKRIHDEVIALSRAPFAFRETGNFYVSNEKEASGIYNLSKNDRAVELKFRTYGEGYLFSNAPLDGPWNENSKGVVIYDGRLIFRDGRDYKVIWAGDGAGLSDGKWHTLVLSSREGMITANVDGQQGEPVTNTEVSDLSGHVFRLGQATKIYRLGASELPDPFEGELFDGEIEQFRLYNTSLDEKQTTRLIEGESLPKKYVIKDWRSNASGAGRVNKGPIRIQSDLSEIRYTNIYVEPLKD